MELTDLSKRELDIMGIIWDIEDPNECTISNICNIFNRKYTEKTLAKQTISTFLSHLYYKKYVDRKQPYGGRTNRYIPLIKKEQFLQKAMQELFLTIGSIATKQEMIETINNMDI